MATALDIITRAARRINVLASEEAPQAADAADGLQVMNDMMHGFGPRGIHYAHVTLVATDTVNLPDEQLRNLVLLLADDLAREYSVPIAQDLRTDIMRAEQQLQAAYYSVPPAKTGRGLLRWRWGLFDITRGQ